MVIENAYALEEIKLGRRGENKARKVVFDVLGKWREGYGEGSASLIVQRNGDSAPYPVTLTEEGGMLVWLVSSADTAVAGEGMAELRYTVGDTVVKSQVYKTRVRETLEESTTEPPEAYQGWVDEVLTAAAGVDTAVSKMPYVDSETGHWFKWDAANNAFADTGVPATGPQGEAGPKGDAGAQGEKGNTGAAGPKGDTGATGAQGPKGETGATGPQGPAGPQGEQGIQGVKGDTGPANTLRIGTVTSGAAASATITGDAPNQVLNLVLEKGDKGDAGTKGDTGEQGKQGIQGETGPQGEQGADAPTITDVTVRQSDYHMIVTLSDGTSYDAGYCRGASGSGSGDMQAEVYDPQGKQQDVFKYVDDAVKDVSVTTDAEPTQGSANPVQSGGVYSALSGKQDKGDYVSYTKHDNVTAGKKANVTTYTFDQSPMVVSKGIIIGGTAGNAGLVTRGISGVTAPNETTGACESENLYINFDGNDTYGRAVVLGASTAGTDITVDTAENAVASHRYGQTLAAVRGDQMVNYVIQKLGAHNSSTSAHSDIRTALGNKLDKTGDGSNATAAFSAATTRSNIATGEKLSVLFGKIAKWFGDLGSLAFKSTVAKTDLANDVQTSLGKADSALQSAPVTSVNGKTGAVTVSVPTVPSTTKPIKGDGSGGLAAAVAESDYASPVFMRKVTLTAAGWDSSTKQQTVACTGIFADNTKQRIFCSAVDESYESAWNTCFVQCAGHAADSLTFQCDEIPTVDVEVFVSTQPVSFAS